MAARSAPSTALLTVGLELLGVAVLVMLAGVSKEVGTVMVIVTAGFWLIFMLSETSIMVGVVESFLALSQNPANTAGVPVKVPGSILQ